MDYKTSGVDIEAGNAFVEKSELIDGSLVRESDVIIGIESSGLHSNGYT